MSLRKFLFGEDEKPEDKQVASEEALKCTVLAIDDDPDMLELIKPVLQAEGFTILTAQSGVKGLDMLRYAQSDVGVILLDYSMPRFSGSDTLVHLRKLAPKAKVIAVTGTSNDLLPDDYKTGVDKFLAKPFKASELVEAIKEVRRSSAATPPPAKK